MSKTIEIQTTQNVTIEYELGSIRERIFAFLMDMLLVLVGCFVLLIIFSIFMASGIFSGPFWGVVMIVTFFLLFFFYNILFELFNYGQTPGKRAMNIRVVRLDGKDPEWSDLVLRALLQMIDSLLSLGVMGVLLIKTTEASQRLGDMAANTTLIRVVNSGSVFALRDILNIASLENYTPVYPQVRQLSEKDMIFIKNVILRCQKYPNQAHLNAMENLTMHLMNVLNINRISQIDQMEFLRTLLRDYIVLTR